MERDICPIAPLALHLTLYSLTGSRAWPLVSRDVISHVTIGGLLTPSHYLAQLLTAETLSLKHFGVTTLTLSGHVMSSITWPLEPQLVVSYWSSVDTMSLSRTVAEILSIKNNWVMSLTPRCHMTSLVTWPLEPHMVLSYWWSVDAKSLSCTVAKILSLKHFGVTTLTLSGHVTSDIIGHVTTGTTVGRFLFVIHWHLVPISHRCWDIKRHSLDNHIPIVNTLETNFGDFGGGIGDYAIFQ